MSGVMPSNEWLHILSVVLLLGTIPPMWSNGFNPVDLRTRGAGERSIYLSIELAFRNWDSRLQILGISNCNDKDRA
jgi:hypothetical protein